MAWFRSAHDFLHPRPQWMRLDLFDRIWPRLVQVVGLFGFLHELILREAERPQILLACAGMIGFHSVKRAQDRRNGRREQ